ncbi:MAG: VCBS repeat-containing protein [Polyangiaceae bacterium]|nr:VCBS repeat-containing protein [Polyangiaceae bacterium]
MRRFLVVTSLFFAPFAGCSCSDTEPDGGGNGGGTAGSPANGGNGGADGGGGSTGQFQQGGAGGGCQLGAPCGDGGATAQGICTEGGVCCAAEQACGSTCCGGTEVCSFASCVEPGVECTDSTECPDGEYCEYSLGEPVDPPDPGCIAGAPLTTGRCLPKPPLCPNGTEPDPDNPTCYATCEVVPPFPTFTPALKFSWGGQLASPFSTDVMMTPVVLSLDDDDCDGKVTARDIPEIIFSTFTSGAYTASGVLHAISVVEGAVIDKWSATGIHPTKQLAAGDFDGQPGNEVVGCMADGTIRAFAGDGSTLWTTGAMSCFMPSIADLDGDGAVEIVVEGGILDGATGALENSFSAALASSFVVSDVDGDGELDVVTGSQVFHADGTLVVDTGVANVSSFYATGDWKSPWPAVADFDLDGSPEVVVVDNLNHQLLVWRVNAAAPGGFEIVRAPVDINGTIPPSACAVGSWGNTHGGGPPTIADFTGDGVPDVATAGGVGYVVFDGADLLNPNAGGAETIQWIVPTVDCSSASTGSTVFDFNGDGVAEVVYGDQQRIRVYDGPTGDVLAEFCNTTATLIENPVVADVDNDGHADIVAVSNAYAAGSPTIQCNDGVNSAQSGVRVFGAADGTWVRTRRVWNQHAYHVTNVTEDGAIPAIEAPNWEQNGLNNFRQNKQPGSEFGAPDAVVKVEPRCTGDYALVATVRNLGEAVLPAGVPVAFHLGDPPGEELLGTLNTQTALYPFEAETLTLEISPALGNGDVVYAVVDEGGVHPEWAECRTDNNQSEVVSAACGVPQ